MPEELLLDEDDELLELEDVPLEELELLEDELLLAAKLTTAMLLMTLPAELVTTTV